MVPWVPAVEDIGEGVGLAAEQISAGVGSVRGEIHWVKAQGSAAEDIRRCPHAEDGAQILVQVRDISYSEVEDAWGEGEAVR